MTLAWRTSLWILAATMVSTFAWAQEPATDAGDAAQDTLETARDTVESAAAAVDKDPRAQEVSAGILNPIYQVAEAIKFPAFHWVAFALMATGVVSFALQLTLGKLVVLGRMGFSLSEILGDALGLAVSVVGLVLTTQAAAENSSFTSSAAAVLSSAIVGVVLGIVFYFWGQRQELQAVEGRRSAAAANAAKVKQS